MSGVPYSFTNRRAPESLFHIDANKVNADFISLVQGLAFNDGAIVSRHINESVVNSPALYGLATSRGFNDNIVTGLDVVGGTWTVSGAVLNPGTAVVGGVYCLFLSPLAVPTLTLSATNYIYIVQVTGGVHEPESAGFLEVTTAPAGGNRILLYEVICDGVGVDVIGNYLPALNVALPMHGIGPDLNETDTWYTTTPPQVVSLHETLSRIRFILKSLGGGGSWASTPPSSVTALWAKFHISTGHLHTGINSDAPQIDASTVVYHNPVMPVTNVRDGLNNLHGRVTALEVGEIHAHWINQYPNEVPDGIRTLFTFTSFTGNPKYQREQVYLSGMRRRGGAPGAYDYLASYAPNYLGITFSVAPPIGSMILVDILTGN